MRSSSTRITRLSTNIFLWASLCNSAEIRFVGSRNQIASVRLSAKETITLK
jgi:hypothetical protein